MEILVSGGGEFYRVGQRGLADLQLGQGLANYLLGQAGTFATLAGDIGRGSHILVTAASFIDRVADLSVSNADTKTHIHKG